jgi:hypothetical protein
MPISRASNADGRRIRRRDAQRVTMQRADLTSRRRSRPSPRVASNEPPTACHYDVVAERAVALGYVPDGQARAVIGWRATSRSVPCLSACAWTRSRRSGGSRRGRMHVAARVGLAHHGLTDQVGLRCVHARTVLRAVQDRVRDALAADPGSSESRALGPQRATRPGRRTSVMCQVDRHALPSAASRSSQARSQRRHSSADRRQCSW